MLDLTGTVESDSSEQGMLGLAFSPDGGQMFVDYVARGGGAGTTKVVRYDMAGGGAFTRAAGGPSCPASGHDRAMRMPARRHPGNRNAAHAGGPGFARAAHAASGAVANWIRCSFA